jgi:D-alanyl-D-alanine carboxypeptidase
MDIRTKRLQDLLNSQIGKGGVHNIVAAVQSQDGKLDFCGAAGTADPQTGAAMEPDTPYFIASITKMFTAAIVMHLLEGNRINLDAPISQYLPASLTQGIHVYKNVDYSGQITVRQLVTQTSGLADHESEKPRGGRSVMDELIGGQDRSIDTAEAVEIIRGLRPHFPPGTPGKAYYSNTNYRLLGEIIQAITGRSMAANFTETICKPLGLLQTYLFDWNSPRTDKKPAVIYLKGTPVHVPKYLASNTSDGGIVSTAFECMIFLRAFFEGKLFDKTYLEQMMTWNPIFFPLRYGYGLMYFKLPGFFSMNRMPAFAGHSGSTGSFAFLCPSRSLYLTGTVNQITPAKPFFLMIDLVRAAK